eukprot:3492085-Rhodomonas_salina.2
MRNTLPYSPTRPSGASGRLPPHLQVSAHAPMTPRSPVRSRRDDDVFHLCRVWTLHAPERGHGFSMDGGGDRRRKRERCQAAAAF